MTQRRWQWLSILVIASAYAWSLYLPVMPEWLGAPGAVWTGWELFLIGLRAPLMWCWWPNPLLFVGILMLVIRYNRTAMILGVVAALGACYWLPAFWEMGAGYYVWLTSMVLLGVSGGCLAFLPNRKRMQKREADAIALMLPDASVLSLFNQQQTKPPLPTKVRSGPPQGRPPSLLHPPCSPSSST